MDQGEYEMIHVGILGAAHIARKTFRALNAASGVTVVAVGSRSKEKAQQLIDGYTDADATLAGHACQAYGSYEEVLADPKVDVVYIPLPSAFHLKWVEKAAMAGKSILLEKPIAVNHFETKSIIDVCVKHGVQLMDGTMWMHHPRTRILKKIIDEGKVLGEVKEVTTNFSFAAPPGFGENIRSKRECDPLGALGDLGWYCIRAILWVFNYEKPIEISIHSGATFNGQGVPTQLGATLLFEGGRRGHFHCGFDKALTQTLLIAGTNGTLRLDDFVIPFSAQEASYIQTRDHHLSKDDLWDATVRETFSVPTDKSQETLMWEEMASCIRKLKVGGKPNTYWIKIAELNQQVVNDVHSLLDTKLAKM